ncbi:MAG: hypothetical protein KAT32_01630 [Candidatus Moranbacteria bacterium]|nr:hypothetical protein [Candidatus Moranbacteria bacterium]
MDLKDREIKDFDDFISRNQDVFFEKQSSDNKVSKQKLFTAINRLRENFIRLDMRYKNCKELQDQFEMAEIGLKISVIIKDFPVDDFDLMNWQNKFVDSVEAFNQQIYSTISVLILVLNYVGLCDKDHPIRSVNKFLDFVKNNIENCTKEVEVLKESINFRAKFVDHPQQQTAYDWMTFSLYGKCCVVYFSHLKDGEIACTKKIRGEIRIPHECKDFCESPDEYRVKKALIDLSLKLLKHSLKIK